MFTTESRTELDFGAAAGDDLDAGRKQLDWWGRQPLVFEGAGTVTMNGTYDVTGTTSGTAVTIGIGLAGTVNFDAPASTSITSSLIVNATSSISTAPSSVPPPVRSEAWRSSNGH